MIRLVLKKLSLWQWGREEAGGARGRGRARGGLPSPRELCGDLD